jgi:hypothetical protein
MNVARSTVLTLAAVGAIGVALPAPAAVLCQKKSGAVFVRAKCKKKETTLDLAQFGAVGPKGDKGDPDTPGAPGVGPLTTCPPDSVLVATTCVDTYEASVWQIAPSNAALLAKVQAGTHRPHQRWGDAVEPCTVMQPGLLAAVLLGHAGRGQCRPLRPDILLRRSGGEGF